MTTNVRIPQIVSLETAIRMYYERIELTNKDILNLFGKMSTATVSRLKQKAREQMITDNIHSWSGNGVSTDSAYKAWHLDIANLEQRFARLQELKLI